MPSRLLRAALVAGMVSFIALAVPLHPRPAAGQGTLPRITFSSAPGASVLVHGTYPKATSSCVRTVQPLLHARYPGTIEVGKDTDGSLFVVGEMSFEDYLGGIAEIPRTWPMAALKAQVVAARTYALSRLGSPDATAARLGYQLCVTDRCQVYRGEAVAGGPYGDRWRRAVARTTDQALLYDGRPAETFYFSTSNGTTHGNAEVFGGSPLPYLKPVKETDDGASALSHWHTAVPFADLARFLSAGGDWPSGTAVTSVKRAGDTIRVSGAKKASRSLDVAEFRAALNSWAPCLTPDRYPTVDGGSRLPQTVPSRWFSLRSSKGAAVLDGRGWGHGVGMVQWGAYGKAGAGMAYDDILAHYYGGLRPQVYAGEPSSIRLGIATGLRSVRVAPSGDVSVAGRTVRPGPWIITGGTRLRIRQAGPPPSYIEAGTLRGPGRAASGQERHATVDLPATSVVRLVLAPEDGGAQDVPVTPARTYPAGRTRITWTGPEAPTGTYRLQAVVTDGTDVVRTAGVRLRLSGVAASAPTPSATPSRPPTTSTPVATASPAAAGSGRSTFLLIASAVAAVLLGALSITYLYRKTEGGGKGPLPPWERLDGGPPT